MIIDDKKKDRMDNNLYIPDMYPVTFFKTITLKVDNIVMHDDTPKGYSFEVECDDGTIIKFDQSISTHPLHPQKIVLNASVGLARYRRIIDQDPLINGCIGLLPPGNELLEYGIKDAYYEYKSLMDEPLSHVNIIVKWPEKEGNVNGTYSTKHV